MYKELQLDLKKKQEAIRQMGKEHEQTIHKIEMTKKIVKNIQPHLTRTIYVFFVYQVRKDFLNKNTQSWSAQDKWHSYNRC